MILLILLAFLTEDQRILLQRFGGSGDADVSLQYLKPVAVLDHEPLRFLTVLSLPAESHYKSLMNWSSPRFIMSIRFIG